jgi:predicted MFS family arabinose efflux permease
VVAAAYAVYALSMAAFYFSANLPMLALGGVLLGVGHGLLFPLVQSWFAKEAPAEGSVLFMSFNIAAIGVGQTVTPMLTSAVFESLGLDAVFLLALVAALAMLVVSVILLRPRAA